MKKFDSYRWIKNFKSKLTEDSFGKKDEDTVDTGYEKVNEDYRDPEENAEILKALLSDPKHSKYVTEELIQWLEDEDELDSFVENMLDELNPDLGRYKLRNIRPESVNEGTNWTHGDIAKMAKQIKLVEKQILALDKNFKKLDGMIKSHRSKPNGDQIQYFARNINKISIYALAAPILALKKGLGTMFTGNKEANLFK